jgi:hypothetical protein
MIIKLIQIINNYNLKTIFEQIIGFVIKTLNLRQYAIFIPQII